jgi:broad specificity phosphatase PhoE
MSSLTLVRHGQASFFAADYDRLSEVGKAQACALGRYWARRGVVFDEVYAGPRSRQRQTAELAGAALVEAGGSWPEPVVHPDFDEYDLHGLQHRLAPELAQQNPTFAELLARYQQSTDDDARVRNFQKAFEALTGHWVTAQALANVETWPVFRERVRRGVRHIQAQPGRGRRVVVFTSGGFIGTAVQLAVAAPDRVALELGWRVRNGSLTEFVFDRDRLTLDGFNAVPHLENPEWWTYR